MITDQTLQEEVNRHREQLSTPASLPVPGSAGAVFGAPDSNSPRGGEAVISGDPELRDHNSFGLADMLFREKYVLGGVSETLDGTKERAKEAVKDWPLTALEVVSGIAVGSALVLASRNPALAAPIKILNRSMLSIAAADLLGRVAIPQIDAIAHPENLAQDRKALGRNIGSAVFDYGLAAVSGGAGSRAMTPFVERTQLGSMIQGYDYFKTPGGAELRVFKSGNTLITKNGVRVFKEADLDPLSHPGSGSGIVGDNDLLRRTFGDDVTSADKNQWKQGKDIVESAGKFATWFETAAGALATEVVDRGVDVGIDLVEHDYLIKQLGQDKKHDK